MNLKQLLNFLVLVFYLMEFYYINLFESSKDALFTGAISAIFFAFYAAVTMKTKEIKHSLTSILLLSSGSITLTHTLFYVIIPGKFRPISLVIASFAIFKFLESLDPKKWKEYSKILGVFLFILIGWNYFEIIFKQFATNSFLPLVSGAVYVVVAVYITFFEKKIAEYSVNAVYGLSIAHIMMLSIVYNLTKNQSNVINYAAVIIYLLSAIGSIYYIFKKNKEITT